MPAAPDVSRTERRKFPRSDVIGTQLVSVEIKPQSSSALLLDVSEGGLALQNLAAMRPGGTREFSFRVPGNSIGIRGSAFVVWKQGDRAGLRFTHLEESSRRVLHGWIQSLSQSPLNRETSLDSHIEYPLDSRAVNHMRPPEGGKPPVTVQELRDEDFYSITARARVVTCATGAALAWEDAEGMVCRASSGLAPAPGARVQLEHGLSGECIRTGCIVRCDDTETDARVDKDVCRQLNLRSAIIVPVIRDGKVTGLIEVFSNKPAAFRNEDVESLKLLAEQCSTKRPAPDGAVPSEPEGTPLRGFRPAAEARSLRSMKLRTVLPWIFGALVLIATATFTLRRSNTASAASRQAKQSRADLAASPATAADASPHNAIPREVTEAFFGKGDAAARSVIRKQRAPKAAPESGSEQDAGDAQEVLTRPAEKESAPPQQNASEEKTTDSSPKPSDLPPPVLSANTASSSTMAALNVPPPALPSGPAPAAPSEITPARLVHSVKPQYPGPARAANVEGTVYLHLKLDAKGHVKDVDVLSGRPDLVHAAVSAVRQWRYDPFKLNGKAIDGETNVTVNFSLKR